MPPGVSCPHGPGMVAIRRQKYVSRSEALKVAVRNLFGVRHELNAAAYTWRSPLMSGLHQCLQ